MGISGDRLRSVDEELAGLGRSDDQIEAVLARFEDREPEDLGAVDEQLATLQADVESMEALLSSVRERVRSTLAAESSEVMEVQASEVSEVTAETPLPPADADAEAEAEADVEAGAEGDAEAEAGSDVAFDVDVDVPVDDTRAPVAAEEEEAPTSEQPTFVAGIGGEGRLSAEALFDDAAEEDDRGEEPDDFSALFGETVSDGPDDLGYGGDVGLAEALESELEGLSPAGADAAEDVGSEPTNVFSSDDIDAIEEHARSSAPPSPHPHGSEPRGARAPSSSPPAPRRSSPPSAASRTTPRSVPPPVPSATARSKRPSQHPRDPDIDALLGDDEEVFRPSTHPPAAGAEPEDFELLVDEDVLLVDEEEEADELPVDMATSIGAPAFMRDPSAEHGEGAFREAAAHGSEAEGADEEPPASPSQAPPEGEDGHKRGFFKKLFGGGD